LTEKLYEQSAYLWEFTAKVQSCEKNGDFFDIILDKTAFFPEGGGQGADKGTINGIEVLDVQIENEIITHKTAEEIPVGTEVKGKLDRELRFARMQSHSAEHVVSGIVHTLFGYENTGFHMSERIMTVDFSGPLTADDISDIELRANKAVYANTKITAFFPTPEEAEKIQYRSKLEISEGLRLVTIEGVDCCACCAPHVGATGEIGLIKVLDFCPNKGGTRLEIVAGIFALEDYISLNSVNKGFMKLFSAKRNETSEAVNRQNDLVNELRGENSRLLKRLVIAELEPVNVGNSAYAFCDGVSYDELRHCSNHLLEKGVNVCVLLSEAEASNYIYVVSSEKNDVKPIVAELNLAFGGKGGGKPNYAQGKISAESKEEIKSFLEKVL